MPPVASINAMAAALCLRIGFGSAQLYNGKAHYKGHEASGCLCLCFDSLDKCLTKNVDREEADQQQCAWPYFWSWPLARIVLCNINKLIEQFWTGVARSSLPNDTHILHCSHSHVTLMGTFSQLHWAVTHKMIYSSLSMLVSVHDEAQKMAERAAYMPGCQR